MARSHSGGKLTALFMFDDLIREVERLERGIKISVPLFQKRHLLMHCDGLVDADYIQKSGDHDYAIRQRIVIRENHVLGLINFRGEIARRT